jgi:hypothetical protein
MRKLSGKGKAKEVDPQPEEMLESGTELDEPNVYVLSGRHS